MNKKSKKILSKNRNIKLNEKSTIKYHIKKEKFKKQQLKWNENTNKHTLITKFKDNSLLSEPLTSKEAAQWQAINKY